MNKNIKTINKINNFFNDIPTMYYLIPFILHIFSTHFLLQNTPHEYAHKEPLYDIIIKFYE